METFVKLFGSLLAFMYHCFDRIVILGHIPLLTRPENIVHFFRDLHQSGAITEDLLRKRTELFPEFRKIVPSNEYDALGEDFEKKEHELFGEDGFDRNVAEVAKLEQALGICDLAQFTPPA